LLVGFNFLLNEIVSLESKLEILKTEGVPRLYEEEKRLCENYIAVQVFMFVYSAV